MHRQAAQFILILAGALAAGCSDGPAQAKNESKKTPEAVAVRTALAEERTTERFVSVTGALYPDETTTVSSEVGGRVARLHADFGQAVKKGQVVAEIETTELSLQLERTRAALAQALARVGLDPRQEEATPESTPQMRQARALLEDAKSKFDNAARLVKSGDVAQERFNEIEKAYLARVAAYDAARDDLRTQLALIRSLRAEVQLAEKRLRDATVVAPFDGSVAQKLVAPGQYIKENVPILMVVKTSPLRLRAEVPETAVPSVRVGSTLTFTTDAAPDAEFQAVVRELNPALDARSRTLTVEARLVRDDARLRPGAFVQVRLMTERAMPVIAVPKAAVYTVAGLYKVFVVEHGKAVEIKLEQVLGTNGWVELPPGKVNAGAVVAVSNIANLVNGAPVRVVTDGKS